MHFILRGGLRGATGWIEGLLGDNFGYTKAIKKKKISSRKIKHRKAYSILSNATMILCNNIIVTSL